MSDADTKYIKALAHHPDPVVTSVELGEKVDVSQQSAHQALQKLEKNGYVKRKEVGARAVVWWLTTKGRERYAEMDV